MKKHVITYLGLSLLSLSCVLPMQADENADVAQLKAAIEAFGVSTEQAEKAATYSAAMIEKERNAASNKSHQDMEIVTDDFFTLTD